ncbi:MAG: hypothetical protein BWK79_07865 [Beggiatoa sp. IS2]|nr:MAG: hypothetical protein BWK79_07865 [Beggiatoa sp. IS2]
MRKTEDCYKGEFKHHVRKLSVETIKDAVSPFLTLIGKNTASMTVILSSEQNWENLPKEAEIPQRNGNELLEFLLGLQNLGNESGIVGCTTLVFYDGEKEHCVSLNKLEGSPSRIYYSDPYGGKSYLSSGNNLMKIQAQHEGKGNYSISCFEFERIIAVIVYCRFGPKELFDKLDRIRDQQ